MSPQQTRCRDRRLLLIEAEVEVVGFLDTELRDDGAIDVSYFVVAPHRGHGLGAGAIRDFAMSLPEVTEEPHFDMTSFRVRGKIFVTVLPDDERLHVFVDESEIRAMAAEFPTWCAESWWGKKLSAVRVTLDGADPERVAELLEDSYRRKAPKKLIAELDAR